MNSASVDLIPVDWHHLLYWAKKTLKTDLHNYKGHPQGLTLDRVKGFCKPNLKNPIFLIGSPRSGTTFLGQCLAALPTVSYHHEPVVTKAALRYIYEQKWSLDQAERLYHFVYGGLMRIHLDGHLRFAEKTPSNCLIIPFLLRAFPQAQFIFIMRDGRDAALSHRKKPWFQKAMADSGNREPGGYLYGPTARFWVEPDRRTEFENTTDLHRCIWNWRVFNESAIATMDLIPPHQLIKLRYEHVVCHPQSEGKRILNFLGVEQNTARGQFLKEMDNARADSIGSWRKELTSEEVSMIEKETGHLLKHHSESLEYLPS